jgi:hypothetical protein
MLNVTVRPETVISLGYQGENLARCAVFDLSVFRSVYGEGSAQLLVIRPGEKEPYPVVLEANGDKAKWVISNADTANAGSGKAEMRWYVGDTLAKTSIWKTTVQAALGEPSDNPPEPYENWMEEMLGVAADASISEAEAKKAAEDAERIKLETELIGAEADAAATRVRFYASDAKKYADSALSYSENAKESETNAATHEENAKRNYERAAGEASLALSHANSAYNHRFVAESYASMAKNYKESAAEYSEAALDSAANAKEAEESAKQYANNAAKAAARLDNIRVEEETLYF